MGNEPFDLFIFDTRFCCDRSEREKHTDSGLLCSYYALFYGVSACIPPYVQKSKFSAAKPYAYVFVNWFYSAYKAKPKTVNKAVYYSSRFLSAYTNSSKNVCKTEGGT